MPSIFQSLITPRQDECQSRKGRRRKDLVDTRGELSGNKPFGFGTVRVADYLLPTEAKNWLLVLEVSPTTGGGVVQITYVSGEL